MPPTDVTASRIAMVNDTCGNLVQITPVDARRAIGVVKPTHGVDTHAPSCGW
jgi:hypothetical protein